MIHEHNQKYLGLDDDQYRLHEQLMAQATKDWPQTLKDYCQQESKKYGFCGDALACWVAEWIKNQWNEPDEPGDEQGRLEAIAILERMKKQEPEQ